MLHERIAFNKLVLTTFIKQNYPYNFPYDVILIIIKMLHSSCKPCTITTPYEEYLNEKFILKSSIFFVHI